VIFGRFQLDLQRKYTQNTIVFGPKIFQKYRLDPKFRGLRLGAFQNTIVFWLHFFFANPAGKTTFKFFSQFNYFSYQIQEFSNQY
jgi:hypothetical protein